MKNRYSRPQLLPCPKDHIKRYAVDLADVQAAAQRIQPHIHRTCVLTSRTLDRFAGRMLHFKCENFQRVGAFKMRGALNAVLSLSDDQASAGVVTHSSGNFAQAVAASARIRGIPAHIVMPENASAVKRRAVEGYGGHVISCPATLEARESTAERVRQETSATLLHPFDQDEVIAGQGTVALELLEQIPRLNAVVVPIGGGGLISGIAIALRELQPDIRIFAAEPKGADDAYRSKQADRLILQTSPDTIADGLLTSLGERTWPVVRDLVERVIVVDDKAILGAMRVVWERMKVVVEPSAATAAAAAFSDEMKELERIPHLGVLLTGGNVDLEKLPFGSP